MTLATTGPQQLAHRPPDFDPRALPLGLDQPFRCRLMLWQVSDIAQAELVPLDGSGEVVWECYSPPGSMASRFFQFLHGRMGGDPLTIRQFLEAEACRQRQVGGVPALVADDRGRGHA